MFKVLFFFGEKKWKRKDILINLVNNLGIFSYDFHKKTGLENSTSKKWLNYGSKDRLHVPILEIRAIEI